MIESPLPPTATTALSPSPVAGTPSSPAVTAAWVAVLAAVNALSAARRPDLGRVEDALADALTQAVLAYGAACREGAAAAPRLGGRTARELEGALDLAFGYRGSQESQAIARSLLRTWMRTVVGPAPLPAPAIDDEPDLMQLNQAADELLATRHHAQAGSAVRHAFDFLSFWLPELRTLIHERTRARAAAHASG